MALACVLALTSPARYHVPQANAIGVANVEVTNIYWGTNPMSPDTAHPGDVNLQLSIVITNVGDDVARGVNATLYLSPPIVYTYIVNGQPNSAATASKIAGDMAAGQSFTLAYTLSIDPGATEGIYRYNLELTYKSARELQNVDKTVEVDVPVWRGELHVQGVVTNPTKIYPDTKQVALQVTIANSGQGAAQNVQLDLGLTYPFTPSSSGSDRIFVGNIPPGQTTQATFIVDVATNATFGQYSLPLNEALGDRSVPIGQVPVYLNEKVKFQVVNISPTTVNAGDSGDVIRVDIRNTGSVKADSVRVELRVGNFFTGTLTDFLGTMQPNETKSAFFTVDIDSKAQPGAYNLDLRFDWTQDNNSLDDTLTLPLTVQSPGIPITLVAVVVVVIIGLGGFLYMRRRRAKAAAAAPSQSSAK